MFYISTWNSSIQKHFSDFKDNYGLNEKDSKSIFDASIFDLNKIFEEDDVCPFFKKILKKFNLFNNITDKNMLIDLRFSSNKTSENSNDNLELKVNLSFEDSFPRPNIKDYSP